jgi:hypothetical protein
MVMYKDPVAGGKTPDRAADCDNFACRLVTQPSGRHAIFSVYLLQVRAAKPAGPHPHKNIAIAGDLRTADFVDRDDVTAF